MSQNLLPKTQNELPKGQNLLPKSQNQLPKSQLQIGCFCPHLGLWRVCLSINEFDKKGYKAYVRPDPPVLTYPLTNYNYKGKKCGTLF
ncbi:hypothetical protein FACS1894200_01130 [Spirochaetia bacterium]|nr:hypothetical protein FACS1894200_01130 [Spirochaetia bacterium]